MRSTVVYSFLRRLVLDQSPDIDGRQTSLAFRALTPPGTCQQPVHGVTCEVCSSTFRSFEHPLGQPAEEGLKGGFSDAQVLSSDVINNRLAEMGIDGRAGRT